MLNYLIAKVKALMALYNRMQVKRFPLDKQSVGGYDYGAWTNYTRHHLGVDWAARYVPLYAPCDGEIIATLNGPEGGLTLWFRPAGETTIIRWLHLSKILCKLHDLVVRGQQLAVTGKSGKAEGPHLHEDIWKEAVTLKFADTLNPHTYYPLVEG